MATKLTLFIAVLWTVAMGTRACSDVQGPLNDLDMPETAYHREANESNHFTVMLRCGFICQEAGVRHIPESRIVTIEDGEVHQGSSQGASQSFTITIPDSFTCDPSDNVIILEYRLTVLNPSFNRSIFQCGLDYNGEICFTDSMAWITIPDITNPSTTTASPPTTTNNPPATTGVTTEKLATTTRNEFTTTLVTDGPIAPTSGRSTNPISNSTIAVIVIVPVVACLILVTSIPLLVIIRNKARRKKVGIVQQEENGSQRTKKTSVGTQTPPSDEISCTQVTAIQDQDSKSDTSTQGNVHTLTEIVLQVPTQDSASESQDDTNSRRHSGIVTMVSVESNGGNPQAEHRDDND